MCYRRSKLSEKLCPAKQEAHASQSFPFLVHGGYTIWSEWGSCSKSCGDGMKSRSRTCTNPAPLHGGDSCDALGLAYDDSTCKIRECAGKYIFFVEIRSSFFSDNFTNQFCYS